MLIDRKVNNNMNYSKPYSEPHQYKATFQIAGSKINRKNPAEIVITVTKQDKQVAVIGLTYDVASKQWKANDERQEGLFMKLINDNKPVSYTATQKYINAQWQYANTCFKTTGVDRARNWDLLSINYR
jgi:hypothetical protein